MTSAPARGYKLVDEPNAPAPTGLRLSLAGATRERVLEDAASLLAGYKEEEGRRYLAYASTTPPDALVPEDLAVTLLINSRAGYRAFKSIHDHGSSLDLAALPGTALDATNATERASTVALVATVASWPGFATSLASKVLHKKRPGLIPIMDNQAIFGAYLNAGWPEKPARGDSVWSAKQIGRAVESTWRDITLPENLAAWDLLASIEPSRTRIELFDMVWWVYFRGHQPVLGLRP